MAIISYLKALLPLTSAKERSDIGLLAQHGVFERRYYQQQMPALQRWLWVRPELHFLRLGWREGLTPSPRFDAQWYTSRYADIGRAKVNPLLHFLRYGIHEGRLPSFEGHISDFPLFQGQAVWLHHQAWHGHAGRLFLNCRRWLLRGNRRRCGTWQAGIMVNPVMKRR